MKQTAMQMAIDHYKKLSEQGSNQAYVVAKFLEENYLEMDKEHIIKAASLTAEDDLRILSELTEEYYNETFKSE